MKQDLVKKIPVLIPTAIKAIIGSTQHAATLHVLQGTPENISFDLNALVAKRDTYEAAKLSLTVTRNTFNLKTQMTRETIRIARDIIKQYLGTEYNQKWDGIGMKNRSIAVPERAEQLYPITLGFKAYFAANPGHENIPLQITAVKMQALYDELVAAQTAFLNEQETVKELKSERDDKSTRLFKRLRAMIEELSLLMGPLDPRWKTFGFNMPGAQETPEVPVNIVAVLIGPNTVAMKWDASARGGHYRVWRRVIGLDTEPVAIGSPADLDITIENLPANSTVELYVSAVNDGGESQLSEKITITTH